jgi:hypothetical protein
LFLVTILTGVATAHSADYFIYRDVKGVLVISNQKPPERSHIIRQESLPDEAESEPPKADAPIDSKAPNPATPR